MRTLTDSERNAINVLGMLNHHHWKGNPADWIACMLTDDDPCKKCGGPMYNYIDCVSGIPTPNDVAGPWCLLDRPETLRQRFPATYWTVRRAVEAVLNDER